MATQGQVQRAPYTSSVGERPARSFIASSIGTKVLVGVTGLMLFLYLILHLAGNLLVYFGPTTFNGYAHMLIKNPLIVPLEIGLAAIFVLHIYKTVTNWWANRQARPVGYYKRTWGGPGSRKSWASSTMFWTGLGILVFVVIHLVQFKYGPEYLVEQATAPGAVQGHGDGVRDLYRLEIEVFSNILNVIFYVFAMVVVGFHLWHGFGSAWQSLGADHPRTTPLVLRLGKVLASIIALGFITIPIWAYFFGGRA